MKKILLGLMIVSTCVRMAHGKDAIVDGIKWSYNDNGKTVIINAYNNLSGDVVIPSQIGGLPVTCIDERGFSGTKITSVTIPASVEKIGNKAFYGCTSLLSVEIQSSAVELGIGVFCGCGSLQHVTGLNFAGKVPADTFNGCSNLLEFAFTHTMSGSESSSSFYECKGLKTVYVESLVDWLNMLFPSAEANPMYDARNLVVGGTSLEADLVIPEGTEFIQSYAFLGCTNIVTLTLPSSIKEVRKDAFRNCSNLSRVTFQGDDLIVDASAFAGTALVSYKVPQTATSINLSGCHQLEEVEIPSDAIMTSDCFAGCASLRQAIFHGAPNGIDQWFVYLTANADSIFYDATCSEAWEKLLKNIGYGGKFGSFRDEWTGIGCVDRHSGNMTPIPTVVTNYVYSTVTNHIYHHDVVTDMTAYHTTVTNVYVHYANENAQPTFVFPSGYDTGFINVVAEVEGGFAVIPATWTVNYPGFTEKYGSDFSKALNKPNGKYDSHGNPMFVWQDYVAGTSPMDVNDVFDATIAIEGGKVVVSHTPVLDEERAALRKYTVYGKKNLMDSEWKEVEPGEELDYNFYRVTVKMK